MSIDHGKLLALAEAMPPRPMPGSYADQHGYVLSPLALRTLHERFDAIALSQPAEAVEAKWVTELRNEAVRGSMKDVYWLSRDQVFELIGDATGRKAPAHPDVIVARATDAAQGAVAVIEKAGDRYGSYLTHCDVTLRLYDGFVPAIGSQFYPRPQAAPAQGDGDITFVDSDADVRWAVDQWHMQVAQRPLVNRHRRSLDDVWRQVIRHFGGDDVMLCGPCHDDLLAAAPSPEPRS